MWFIFLALSSACAIPVNRLVVVVGLVRNRRRTIRSSPEAVKTSLQSQAAAEFDEVGEALQTREKRQGPFFVALGSVIGFASFVLLGLLPALTVLGLQSFMTGDDVWRASLLGLGLGIVCVVLLEAGVRRVFQDVPMASDTPEGTCQAFWDKVLSGNLKRDAYSAYVCLTDEAKAAYGGYDGFVLHWSKKRRQRPKRALNITASRMDPSGTEAECLVLLSEKGKEDLPELRIEASLLKVGDRWYLKPPIEDLWPKP
ncbi:MAG: hypothetical protein AB1646_17095 [Thermodesulfobacteriota bacterium]